MQFPRPKEPSGLDQAIEQILAEMAGYNSDDDEYDKMTHQLEKLYAIKAINRPERVSRDTLAMIAGNITVALIVVAYEQKSIVTSRVGQFLMKVR